MRLCVLHLLPQSPLHAADGTLMHQNLLVRARSTRARTRCSRLPATTASGAKGGTRVEVVRVGR
eukprot:364347-Chlamydomonas_euryale.AAC.18